MLKKPLWKCCVSYDFNYMTLYKGTIEKFTCSSFQRFVLRKITKWLDYMFFIVFFLCVCIMHAYMYLSRVKQTILVDIFCSLGDQNQSLLMLRKGLSCIFRLAVFYRYNYSYTWCFSLVLLFRFNLKSSHLEFMCWKLSPPAPQMCC